MPATTHRETTHYAEKLGVTKVRLAPVVHYPHAPRYFPDEPTSQLLLLLIHAIDPLDITENLPPKRENTSSSPEH